MFEADQRYPVTIASATMTESASKGTPGIELRLESADGGKIWHTLWLTEGTRPHVAKTLAELGVDKAMLASPAFWDDPGEALNGKDASIVTEEDTYNGKTRVRVKWLNGPVKAAAAPPPPKPGRSQQLALDFGNLEDVPF